MVERQLRARGIGDERVLAAMAAVPRELFVPDAARERAYEDVALPIGGGQTISQPYMVALICSGLRLRGGERVLDVGTGSGYQAAVLAEMGADVHSIERVPELAVQAREALDAAGYADRVHVHVGDGTRGLPEEAPFAGDRRRGRGSGRAPLALRPARRGRPSRRPGGPPPRAAARGGCAVSGGARDPGGHPVPVRSARRSGRIPGA